MAMFLYNTAAGEGPRTDLRRSVPLWTRSSTLHGAHFGGRLLIALSGSPGCGRDWLMTRVSSSTGRRRSA
jgi:hypothetical protein